MTNHPREIKVTNTLSGKKELLQTITPGHLSFYSCGPTVYNFIHIGNLRGGLVADLFFRYFQRAGYDVTYVRNYTDVDDKIIQRAKEEGSAAEEIAKKYTLEVEKDFAAAGMLEPTHKTTVTTHMQEIIAMIEKIIANGRAYVTDDGEVLFSIDKDPDYGKLSQKQIDELVAGARVEVSSKKKNPLDFSLWKPAKPGEPSWDSPWGKGRPGWHIECSAMASKWLGDQIDVHHGGEDLIFPHHESEMAQSESATGKGPFVRYWLHHAFLTLSKEKMSKSLGNVFSAREFLTRFGGEVARYMLLSVHYRSIIDFSEDTVEHSLTGLQRIYEAKQKAAELSTHQTSVSDPGREKLWKEFITGCEKARTEIDDHYANDFNTAGALASLFSLIRNFNRTLAEPAAVATSSAALGARALISIMEEDIGQVIGVGRSKPEKILKELEEVRLRLRVSADGEVTRPSGDEIGKMIIARAEARKAKNFAEADRIRKDLESRGVILKDSPQGTTWHCK
jgi:cysteinyl-tRNA synthetase